MDLYHSFILFLIGRYYGVFLKYPAATHTLLKSWVLKIKGNKSYPDKLILVSHFSLSPSILLPHTPTHTFLCWSLCVFTQITYKNLIVPVYFPGNCPFTKNLCFFNLFITPFQLYFLILFNHMNSNTHSCMLHSPSEEPSLTKCFFLISSPVLLTKY